METKIDFFSIEAPHEVGVQYIKCACGKHIVHVKREGTCPNKPKKRLP